MGISDAAQNEHPESAGNPETGTRSVRRAANARAQKIGCDICVIGSGAAGISAAIEAARLGRKVILVDGLPALGGQAVNSIIGTYCGLYSNGAYGYQFTHGVADDILNDLGKLDKALYYRHGPVTTVVYYDEIALSRWVETMQAMHAAGVTHVFECGPGKVLAGLVKRCVDGLNGGPMNDLAGVDAALAAVRGA